jgi:hypothetical protein
MVWDGFECVAMYEAEETGDKEFSDRGCKLAKEESVPP